MGFLYHAIRLPSVITLSFFLSLLSRVRFLFIGALTRLGLYKPPPEDDPDSRDSSNNYILILDGASPSLVPIPVHVVIAAIKSKVPVLLYGELVKREEGEAAEELCELQVCTICLEVLEWSHEVRPLCRCAHLFHRECLDTWIDEGQVTCPMCRSLLLPPKTNLTRCNANRDGLPPGARSVAT